MQHRPLKPVEKAALRRYFDASNEVDAEAFVHWPYAADAEIHALETWIWGMRFFGRECVVRAACAALEAVIPLWETALVEEGGSEITTAVKYGNLTDPAEILRICNYWTHNPGAESVEQVAVRMGDVQEAWTAEAGLHAHGGRIFLWTVLCAEAVMEAVVDRDYGQAAGYAAASAATVLRIARSHPAPVDAVRQRIVAALEKWMARTY